jgi:hypothetical protein
VIARTSYTFRSFTHNYLLTLARSLKGPDGKIALDVMMRSLAYLALFGGLGALPFLDDLLDEAEKFLGVPYRARMRKAVRGAGGEMIERFMMTGLPALIGIDLSGSLKIGVPKPSVQGVEESVYGVYGGLLDKAGMVMESMARDDIERAIEAGSPVFIENLFRAYRMMEKGVTSSSGKVVFDREGQPVKLTGLEAVEQALGFRPERLSALGQEGRSMENTQARYRALRNDLSARLRLAGTDQERQRVWRDIQRYNLGVMKYRGAVPRITRESMMPSLIQVPEKRRFQFEEAI